MSSDREREREFPTLVIGLKLINAPFAGQWLPSVYERAPRYSL